MESLYSFKKKKKKTPWEFGKKSTARFYQLHPILATTNLPVRVSFVHVCSFYFPEQLLCSQDRVTTPLVHVQWLLEQGRPYSQNSTWATPPRPALGSSAHRTQRGPGWQEFPWAGALEWGLEGNQECVSLGMRGPGRAEGTALWSLMVERTCWVGRAQDLEGQKDIFWFIYILFN